MGTKDARIHTGRNDRNGRPRATDRRTSLELAAFKAGYEAAVEDVIHNCHPAAALKAFKDLGTQTEAGDESLDGLHPRDEG